MKVIILGASGKIGREIVRALEHDHEVISASRGGEVQADYTQPKASVSPSRYQKNLAIIDKAHNRWHVLAQRW